MQFLFEEILSSIDICNKNFVHTCINCAIFIISTIDPFDPIAFELTLK